MDRGRRAAAGRAPSPVFLGCVVTALAAGTVAWRSGTDDLTARLAVFVMVLAAWVVALSLHEFAHAYTAHRAGDRAVAANGYLTLNPFRYAHPVLSIVLPVLAMVQGGIGLPGGAVPVNLGRFTRRAWRTAVPAAGPLTNVAVAAAALGVIATRPNPDSHLAFWAGVAFFAFLQVSVAVLNLLPIPGLDGWAIWEPHLRPATAAGGERMKPYGVLVVFLALGWIPPLASAFFRVADGLTTAAGVQSWLWQTGYQLFQFWHR